jgi:enamine deaminase RidA (YjgF/YER057c/UK114 family)
MNRYSHGAEVHAGSRLIYLAGQAGVAPDGTIPEDFETQTENTYRNIEAILNDAGMGLENIVKATTFILDPENLPKMREIRNNFFGDHRPAHTLLVVSRLAYPEFQIEVECVAAED